MKAILVIDMPKKCEECPFFENEDVRSCLAYMDFKAYTIILTKVGEEKAHFCPLKPMPQKMKVDYDTIATCEVTEKVVAMGWNACIDEILGE